MFIHVPRVAVAILKGRAQRATTPAAVSSKWGWAVPHVYSARAGVFFDIDSFGHMNNAAYLVHCELARWQLTAATGILDFAVREKAAFIVGMIATRFKREIKPLQRFEIHSQVVDFDDKWMSILHEFRAPKSGNILAMTVCRAVLKQQGGILPPAAMFEALGLDLGAGGTPRPEVKDVLEWTERLDDSLRTATSSSAPRDRL
jgi:acyl-CoA thioesterase FadM